ncbi:MAG: efflux RND transporter periplasmic adaptor subunit [Alistipes sp.]|nr:efflux RND transporter periplasmic adaptor subunit [Alistipes sp.]
MKKSNIIGLTLAIVVVIVTVSLVSWFAIKPVPTLIQGEVEVKSVKISSKLAGRIEQMDVRKGQQVTQGELLFVLSTPEVEAKLQQAEAVRSAAGAQSAKARKGARSQEIEGARNLWQKALAGVELAQKSYDRVKNLYDQGVVPAQKFDEATAYLKAMQTTAAAAKSQYDMAVEGARSEDRAAAAALVDQASGAVNEVTSYMADARQYAPINGEVSTVIAEQGELIGAGYPVITLLDMSDLWVTFNIKEDLLPRIKVGTLLQAFVPGLGRSIELKVDYLAVQAEYATWSATRTKGDFDIRTFEVQARPVEKQSGLRPGMTVTVNWDEIR